MSGVYKREQGGVSDNEEERNSPCGERVPSGRPEGLVKSFIAHDARPFVTTRDARLILMVPFAPFDLRRLDRARREAYRIARGGVLL